MSRLFWSVASTTVTVTAYLLLLGWNARMWMQPEEPGAVGMECAGPHRPWEIVTLGVVLAVLVVAGTWFGHPLLVGSAVVVTLTPLFAVDAVTVDDPCSDTALLPIGVLLLFVGSAVAATGLVGLTLAAQERNRRRPGGSGG